MDLTLLFAYITIDIVGIIILTIVNRGNNRSKALRTLDQRLFSDLIIVTIFIFIFDMGMSIFNQQTFVGARALNIFSTGAYYLLNPLPCLFWFLYADYKIHGNTSRTYKLLLGSSIIYIVYAIITIFSCFYDVLFFIDEHNNYMHGRVFWLEPIFCYGYLLTSFIQILRNWQKQKDKKLLLMMPLSLVVGAASIVQSLFYGLSIIWISLALCILVVYFIIQNDNLQSDYLTGLYNRRKLMDYLSSILSNRNRSTDIVGVMFDIDKFKNINDHFGHDEGDKVLMSAGQILKKAIGPTDLLVRYAGDEFIVILRSNDPTIVNELIDNVKKEIDKYQANLENNHHIHFSYGTIMIKPDSTITADEFIQTIDYKMYMEKEKIKMHV